MPREVGPRSRRRIPITSELLSAHLDNQVTPEERAAVEQAIAEDPTIAGQAHALSQTVALLRALPRASVPRAFTLSEADVASAHTPWWERNWRRLAFAFYLRGAALVAAALFILVVVADLRQSQPLPMTIGAQRELTTVVARGDLPALATSVAAEGAQPTPPELPAPGEADLAAASSATETIVPEVAPVEEAPTGEAELLARTVESSPTGEAELPMLGAEPSPTALPAPTAAPPPVEEPLEGEPLAAAPVMGGGLLEPLDQEDAGLITRGGGGLPGEPGLGGAGGIGGGAEGPLDRSPPVFSFAPPPVGGELPAAPALGAASEAAEASTEPVTEAPETPTAAAAAMAAPASESPTVGLPPEGAEVLTGPATEAPATESLAVELPAEEAPTAPARVAAPAAVAASAGLAAETPTTEPAVESSKAAAPTATLTPSPIPTIMPSPTAASLTMETPTVGPAAEESLAAEAPIATLAPSPTSTMSSSPTALPELLAPTAITALPATPSESPTPPASPSPVPSPALMAQEGATASASQQEGQAEIGLRFGPWTLTPGQARALKVVLGASVVILLAASWLVRRR